MQVDGVDKTEIGIDRHRRPLDAAIGAGQHARAIFGGQHPHVLLRHHGLGEADQAAILRIMNIDMSSLARMEDALNHLSLLVFDRSHERRRHRIEVPQIMRDILEMTYIFAGIEIDRHQ